MSGSFAKYIARLRRDARGAIAVEFALLVPVLLTIFLVLTEMGRVLYQSNAVEKGVRAGAIFASRTSLPLSAADETTIRNLVRTGDPTGGAVLLASGWAEAGTTLDISTAGSFDPGGGALPVVRIEARVPFTPLMPGLMDLFGMGRDFQLTAVHQQPYIGD